MRKTNDELDDLIAQQEALISNSVEEVDVRRGSVSKAKGQLIHNRNEAIKLLENQKEVTTVNLRAGL